MPGSTAYLLLTFSTPLPELADAMVELFDAVAHSPGAVALVDRRETVLALLPWETWFAGDGGEARPAEFCEAAGIARRQRPERAFGRKDFQDRSAMPWGREEYGERHALFAPLRTARRSASSPASSW